MINLRDFLILLNILSLSLLIIEACFSLYQVEVVVVSDSFILGIVAGSGVPK